MNVVLADGPHPGCYVTVHFTTGHTPETFHEPTTRLGVDNLSLSEGWGGSWREFIIPVSNIAFTVIAPKR